MVEQLLQARETRLRDERGCVLGDTKHPQQAAHLLECRSARALDRRERLMRA